MNKEKDTYKIQEGKDKENAITAVQSSGVQDRTVAEVK